MATFLSPLRIGTLYTTIEMALYTHKMGNMLKESEERFQNLIDNAHDAIYIIAPYGFQYANPAFEKLTGWEKKSYAAGNSIS